jgi:hypothetical protein
MVVFPTSIFRFSGSCLLAEWGNRESEKMDDFLRGLPSSWHNSQTTFRSFLTWQQHSRSEQWIQDPAGGSSTDVSSRIVSEIKFPTDEKLAMLFLDFLTACLLFQIWVKTSRNFLFPSSSLLPGQK